ncbi:MAG: hypothetical protein AB9879_03275 [Methanothrix sp.]
MLITPSLPGLAINSVPTSSASAPAAEHLNYLLPEICGIADRSYSVIMYQNSVVIFLSQSDAQVL